MTKTWVPTKEFEERESLRALVEELMQTERSKNRDRAIMRILELVTDEKTLRAALTWSEGKTSANDNYTDFENGWAYSGVYEDDCVRMRFSFQVNMMKYQGIRWSFEARAVAIEEDRYTPSPTYNTKNPEQYEGEQYRQSVANLYESVPGRPQDYRNSTQAAVLITQSLERVCELIQSGDFGKPSEY